MKKELKERWVSALRSGVYKQTKHYLCDDQGWCCLGVLCNLVDPNGWQEEDKDEDSYARSYWFADGNTEKEFPDHDWLNDIGLDLSIARSLASSNDEGTSFSDLADLIEENVNVDDCAASV